MLNTCKSNGGAYFTKCSSKEKPVHTSNLGFIFYDKEKREAGKERRAPLKTSKSRLAIETKAEFT